METNRMNILKAIRSNIEGTPQGKEEAQSIESAREGLRNAKVAFKGGIQVPTEYRATIAAKTTNSGIEAISEQKMGLIEPLRSALVLPQAGAQFIPGLIGDVSMPTYTGTTTLWKGENAAAVDGAGTTDEILMTPKRLTTMLKISKLFLIQDTIQASDFLLNDIIRSIADKLESTIFGTGAASSTQPGGLFNVLPIAPYIGSVTWDKILSLEQAVDTANALVDGCSYITNAAGRGLLKSTLKQANAPVYLMDPDGKMNGYNVLVTNHVPGSLQAGQDEQGILFGNWSDLLIGQWGNALDITVDPFSAAGTGEIVLTVSGYFDAKLRRAVSIKTGTIKA